MPSRKLGVMGSAAHNTEDMPFVERSFFVSDKLAGKRVDQALQLRYPNFSRSYWRKQIDRGRIRIADKTLRASTKLKYGQRIIYPRFTPVEPDVDVNVELLYSDRYFLVIHKPADLPVHPAGVYYYNSLYRILQAKACNSPDWFLGTTRFIGRLDRETSGLMLIAKNKDTAVYLQSTGVVAPVYRKVYLVAVHGEFPDELDAVGFMGPRPDSVVRKMRMFQPNGFKGGVACRTHFHRLYYNREKQISLLLARLYTGRQHQIRASLRDSGWPVVGDRLYGHNENEFLRFIDGEETEEEAAARGIARTALHCAQLSVLHPTDGQLQEFYAPPPMDIRQLFPGFDFGLKNWQQITRPFLL